MPHHVGTQDHFNLRAPSIGPVTDMKRSPKDGEKFTKYNVPLRYLFATYPPQRLPNKHSQIEDESQIGSCGLLRMRRSQPLQPCNRTFPTSSRHWWRHRLRPGEVARSGHVVPSRAGMEGSEEVSVGAEEVTTSPKIANI